jgi:hypothetical protein
MHEDIVEREPGAVTFSVEEVRAFIVDFIRLQHPEWVRDDGTCPKCIDYYNDLDEVEVVPDTRPRTVD